MLCSRQIVACKPHGAPIEWLADDRDRHIGAPFWEFCFWHWLITLIEKKRGRENGHVSDVGLVVFANDAVIAVDAHRRIHKHVKGVHALYLLERNALTLLVGVAQEASPMSGRRCHHRGPRIWPLGGRKGTMENVTAMLQRCQPIRKSFPTTRAASRKKTLVDVFQRAME
ncbi:hypothetical protein BC940DRAFT_11169 [Gongronella butleri]|nr:hypothetical protein BC940DRAFT_11169 [Gongronella butleri]